MRGRVGIDLTATPLAARYTRVVIEFDVLIIVLSVAAPLGPLTYLMFGPLACLNIISILVALAGIAVGIFNWFIAPYAREGLLHVIERVPIERKTAQ
jgi:hypothetical protein